MATSKIVIVTGAGSGLGQAIATEFAKSGGYNVVITDRTGSKLETTAQMCKDQGLTDQQIMKYVGDVTKPDDNARLVELVIQNYGQIDTLVNNAGQIHMKNFADTTLADLDDMYQVLLRGVFDLTQKVMPYLIKTKGCVLNNSSTLANCPFPGAIGYAIMKACLDHFTRIISVEYGPKGVRVNGFNPGAVPTGIMDFSMKTRDAINKTWEGMAKCHVLGRLGEASEISQVVVFLASDAASFITGANIPIDGGCRNTMAMPTK